jgi:single-strand DNA-binding protein
MAGSVNKVILIGNLGADPEVKTFQDGNSIANIRVATSDSYLNQAGERITSTEWHNVVLRKGWASLAERSLKKGDKIYIEGALKTRKWQDQNGQDRYSVEIVAQYVVTFNPRLDSNSPGGQSQQAGTMDMSTPPAPEMEGNDNDDLPF